LKVLLSEKTAPIDVTINAHKDVEDGQVMEIALGLSTKEMQGKIKARYTGVTEKTK